MASNLVDNPEVRRLFQAVQLLKSDEECAKFFNDLCTMNELRSLTQRLEVARLLRAGMTYTQVEAQTGASTATISRVKRFLEYGAGGYTLVLDRLATQAIDEPGEE